MIRDSGLFLATLYTSALPLSISRDVCKSRIHDRRDYRDFRLVPWFLAIAMNLCHGRDYHQNLYNFDC